MSYGYQCDQCGAFAKRMLADSDPPGAWVVLTLGTNPSVHCCGQRCAMAYLANSAR